MKKNFLTIFAIGLVMSALSQEVSQMHQFFAMNPLVKRDPLFQKVQNNIQSQISQTSLGFNENVSAKILAELRRNIRGIHLSVSMEQNSDSVRFRGWYPGLADSIQHNFYLKTRVEDALDSITYFGVNAFTEFIYAKLRRPTSGGTPEEELVFFILGRFNEGISGNSYQKNMTYDELVLSILEVFRRQLFDYLKIVKQDARFLKDLNSQNKKDLIKKLNEDLQGFLTAKKDQLYQHLDIIESELDDFKEKISKGLIAANTGISVSSDEGNLGGGLYVSMKTSKSASSFQLEIGAYVNGAGEVFEGNLGSDSVEVDIERENGTMALDTMVLADDNVEQPFLAGVAFKCQVGPKVQVNALLTYHFLNDDQIDMRTSWEVGGGVIYNTQANLILGLAAFYQFLDRNIIKEGSETSLKASSVWSLGLTFQNTIPGSPMIMVGVTKEDNKSKPLPSIQISYPINFN